MAVDLSERHTLEPGAETLSGHVEVEAIGAEHRDVELRRQCIDHTEGLCLSPTKGSPMAVVHRDTGTHAHLVSVHFMISASPTVRRRRSSRRAFNTPGTAELNEATVVH